MESSFGDNNTTPPLVYAVDTLNEKVVKRLIQDGADVNLVMNDPTGIHDSVLLHAIRKEINGDDCSVTELLLDSGAKVDPAVDPSCSYLSFCCLYPSGSQFLNVLRLLVQYGASRKTVVPKLWAVFDEGMRVLFFDNRIMTPACRLSELQIWTHVSLFANEVGSEEIWETFFQEDSAKTQNEICGMSLGTIDPKFASYVAEATSDPCKTAISSLCLAPIKAVFAVAGHIYAFMSAFGEERICALAHVDGGGWFPLKKADTSYPRPLRQTDDLYLAKPVVCKRRLEARKENWKAIQQDDLDDSSVLLRESSGAFEIRPPPGCVVPVIYTKFKWPARWTRVEVEVVSSNDHFRACLFFEELDGFASTALDDRASRRIRPSEGKRRTTVFSINPPIHEKYQTLSFRVGLQCQALTVERMVIEVTEEVLVPRTSLICFGSLPVGSIINREQDNLDYSYVGYTASNMVCLRREDAFECVPMDRSLKLVKKSDAYCRKDVDQPGEGGGPFNVTRRKFLNDSAVFKTIQAHLHSQTIRGLPLYDLLNFLHCKCGLEVPVAVVGGAIRDILLLQDINDTDFVIGRAFPELRSDIERFFAQEGIVLSSDALKCFPEFGMVKLLPIPGVDKESVDIGIFKSNTCAILPPRFRKRDETYIFGFSYEQDSEFRDYNTNAIYVDIFGMASQELPAGAVISLRGGREATVSKFVKLSAKDMAIKFADVGGRLRIWKMLKKDQVVTDSHEICLQLKIDALQILQVLDPAQACNFMNTDLTSNSLHNNPLSDSWVDDWLWNFATKLFKGKIPGEEAHVLKNLVYAHREPNGIMWWNISLIIAEALVAKNSRFLSRICSGDNSESIRVWEVFEVLRKRAHVLRIPKNQQELPL